MGAGKSEVGRLVAALRFVSFVDLDHEVESRAGRTIPEVFAQEGERGFRRLETAALVEVAARLTPAVVATGGGVVLAEENVTVMRDRGLVVWLTAPLEELARRVGDGSGRPLLEGGDLERRLAALAAEREPRYREAAHHRVETSGRSLEEVAEEVAGLWTAS